MVKPSFISHFDFGIFRIHMNSDLTGTSNTCALCPGAGGHRPPALRELMRQREASRAELLVEKLRERGEAHDGAGIADA